MPKNFPFRSNDAANINPRHFPVTCAITALTIIGFLAFQPSDIEVFAQISQGKGQAASWALYPVKVILGSFLHVNFFHILSNLTIWIIAGIYVETAIGSRGFIVIAFAAALFGGLLETLWVDPKFVGLSSACYGLIGFVIWQKFAKNKGAQGIGMSFAAAILFAAVDTTFNFVAVSGQIAYTAHIGGLMAGLLSSFGLNNMGKDKGPNRIFRPMTVSDINPILEIIYDHDEDDGEDAEAAFSQSLDDKYVMEFEGRIMGMTGFRTDTDAENTAWLSYTYTHHYFRKNGNAYWMMIELRNVLLNRGIERLFIATSDYIDEDTGEDIYLAARNFYENKLNAEREIRINDFYAPGESKYIYSLPVNERSVAKTVPNIAAKARFVGLDEAAESDTSYVVLWEDDPADTTREPSNLPTKSLEALIDEVRSYSGKALFLTLPDYISQRHSIELRTAGFTEIGTLRDYFSKGVGEVYWGLYFE